ncbi:MAG: DUF285 domain-containing protein, partial [Bacteroidales bacterium]|nr:DUF285 domain-containing protein [Bacteroidales bacterium]
LETLDLSSWNVSNGTDFSYMFWDCFNLKTLDLSNWNVKKSAKIEEMFINCTNIKYFKFK